MPDVEISPFSNQEVDPESPKILRVLCKQHSGFGPKRFGGVGAGAGLAFGDCAFTRHRKI
jgi:hypothetical protein